MHVLFMSSQTHSLVIIMRIRISLFSKVQVKFFFLLFRKVSRPRIKYCGQNVNIINQCKFLFLIRYFGIDKDFIDEDYTHLDIKNFNPKNISF